MNLYTNPTKVHINGLYILVVPKNGKYLFDLNVRHCDK
jgi:hypothetical protein